MLITVYRLVALAAALSTMVMVSGQAHAQDNTPLMERVGIASERGECLVVDVNDQSPVTEQERQYMFAAGYVGVAGDLAEQVYSPDCFDGEAPYMVYVTWAEVQPTTPSDNSAGYDGKRISELSVSEQDYVKNNVCYDVVGTTYEDAVIEFLPTDGCVGDKRKSGETSQQGTYAEDGSYIDNPAEYYGNTPNTSNDGWLVLRWTQGKQDNCATYVSGDKSAAQGIADQYISEGYKSAAVHYTTKLDNKTPNC